MAQPEPPGPSPAQIIAANLHVDAVTAEVVRVFQAQGIQSRLLKGASIAHWLYSPTDPRSYVDCDLLVRPADIDTARTALTTLGFVPEVEEARMPAWWREHAVAWLRTGDSAAVDIHRTLPGIGIQEGRAWEILSGASERIAVGGADVETLAAPARALHVSLHAAQHGPEWGGAVTADLDRALARVDELTWRSAAELAASLDATAAFATGLRLHPQGAELADRLELPHARPADVTLRLGGAPPVALGFEQLAQAAGPIARLRVLARKIVPPPTFIRRWYPPAAESRRGLVVGYLWRPLWLLGHAPAGLRAWLRARRES
jgi:Uncharacterised nucleotidyltransferase